MSSSVSLTSNTQIEGTTALLFIFICSAQPGCRACGIPRDNGHRSPPGLLGNAYGGADPPRRTDVVQLPLDHPEGRIHGSIRRSATPGHMEALPGEQECNAYGVTPSLLHKSDTRLTDVVIGRVEGLQ